MQKQIHIRKKSYEIEIKVNWTTDLGSTKYVSWYVSKDNQIGNNSICNLNDDGIESNQIALDMAVMIKKVGFDNFIVE